MSHTQNTHVAAPSYGPDAFARPQAFAAPLNPASFTRCFGCPSPPPLPYLAPDPSRSHARRGRTNLSHHSTFPVSKRNYQVHKCQDFIDKWENCCNNAKKEAAVCAAQGKPYTWTKG